MKKMLLMFLNILLLSFFNVMFRYVNVQNSLENFNSSSSVVSGFMTTSNTNEPYLKIFVFSFILSFLFFVLIILFLKHFSNISFLEVISKLNNFIVLIFTVVSILFLYFNTVISFIFLIVGLVLFIYYIYRNFNLKKYIYILLLSLILYLLILYFISF